MKKFLAILVFLVAVSSLAFAGSNVQEKAKLGPCVRECVHTFNPSLAASDADEFLITDFNGFMCVEMCKVEKRLERGYVEKELGSCESDLFLDTSDGCCNLYDFENDADCVGEDIYVEPRSIETGGDCNENIDCYSNKCIEGICTAPPVLGMNASCAKLRFLFRLSSFIMWMEPIL